jgi:hypothetical protein
VPASGAKVRKQHAQVGRLLAVLHDGEEGTHRQLPNLDVRISQLI